MIKQNRQYRLPSFDEVMVGEPTKKKLPSFDEVMGEAPKKKDEFPLLYKRSKNGSLPAILPSRAQLKSEENKLGVTPEFAKEFAQKTKRTEATDKDIEQDVYDDISKSLQSYEGDDPLGGVLKASKSAEYFNPDGTPDDRANIKAFTKKLEMLENAFESGTEARRLLQNDVFAQNIDNLPIEEVRKLAANNITKQYAVQRYEKLRNVENALKEARTLEEAAVKYSANTDDNVKYLLEKSGGLLGGFSESTSAIPLAVRGEKMLQFLMNDDVQQLADQNPDLRRQVKEEIYNFPLRHPEYATRMMAEAIARKRDEKGLNKYFANVVGKESTDEIVNELIKQGYFPENYRKVYEDNIRPKLGTWQSIGRGIGNTIGLGQIVNDAPIKTPGLLENIGEGWERTYRGTAKTIANLPELVGLPGVQDMMQPEAQQLYNVMKEQAETPQYEPEGLLAKTTMHGGQLGGFMAGLLGGAGALKATNIIKNPTAASTAMMVLSTHSDNADKAKTLFPRNDFKQFLYTTTMDGLNAAMGKFLPGHQLPKLLKGGETTVAGTLKKMVDGDITTDAAKNVIMNWFSNTAKGSLKGGEFMGAISAADDLLTQTLQGKGIDFSQSVEAGWEGFKTGLLATGPLAAFEGALKTNTGLRKEVMDIAKNPEYYKRILERESENDPELAQSKADILENIDYVSKVYGEAKDKSPKEQQQFVLNSLATKVKTKQAESATDPTIKKRLQTEIKNLNEVNDGILNGVPEEKVRLNQITKEVKTMYDSGYLTNAAKGLLESVEGEAGKPKFDDGKVKSFLETVASDTSKKYPSRIRELADEMFPDKKAEREDVKEEEISEPVELSTELPEGFEMPKPEVEAEVNIPVIEPPKGVGGEPPVPPQEGVGEPPLPPRKPVSIHVEEPPFRLVKKELERVRSEMGMENFEGETVSNLEAITKAHRTIQEWKENGVYEKEMTKIIDDVKLNKKINDESQNVLAQYIADLRITAKGMTDRSSTEYNEVMAKLIKATEAGDILRSEAGRVLGRNTLRMRGEKFESVVDVELDMMKDFEVNELTPEQKVEAEKRYNDLNSKFEKEEQLRKEAETEVVRLREEIELLKVKKASSKSRKKTDEEYKRERSDIISSIKKKWGDAGKDVLSSDIPYRKQLAAIATDVGRLIANYVEQGVAKTVEEVRKVLKKDIEDAGISVTDEDVRGLIAGAFSEKKATRTDLASDVYALRREEKLLLELEALERGEVPENEKKAIRRNQRLKELRDKIDDINKSNKIGKYSDESKFQRTIKQRIEANRNKQKELEERINKGDFSEPAKEPSIVENKELQAKNKKLYEEYLQSAADKQNAIYEYEKKRLDDQIKNHSTIETLGDYADITVSTSKGIVAMFDQSGVLVQMLGPTLSHPVMTAKNLPMALRDLLDNKWFDKRMAKLKASKMWDVIEKSELAIFDPKGINEDVRNELLGGRKNLLNRDITIGGKKFSMGKAFERSTARLFNEMRVTLFLNRVNQLYAAGKTWEKHPEEFKSAARAINEWTAAGKLPKEIAQSAPILNRFIWSPKMMASTYNILGLGDAIRPVQTAKAIGTGLGIKMKENKDATKGFWTSLTPTQRKFMITEIGRAVTSAAILMIASRLAGWADDVDLNPISTGFGSVKYGSREVNVLGRYGGVIKTISQVATGKREVGGKIDYLGDKYGDKNAFDVFYGSQGRGKMTPAAGLFHDLILNRQKNYYTREPITPLGALKQTFVPLSFQEMGKDIDKDGALKGTLITLLKIYGGNVKDERDYEKKK